jgi:hypothetical protein
MIDSNNQLPYLAARVGKGDPRAVLELKHELEAQMPRIVRRAMRPTAGASALTQWVRATAQRLSQPDRDDPAADPEQLVSRIVDDLCESVIDRLQSGRRDGHPFLETVRI